MKPIGKIKAALRSRITSNEPNTIAQAYYDKAVTLEASGNLEEAHSCYLMAAEAGLSEAMFKLYDLYMNKGFHPKEETWMLEAALAGKPVMPWDMNTKKTPDVESGTYWLRKAAESGHVESSYILGHHFSQNMNRFQMKSMIKS